MTQHVLRLSAVSPWWLPIAWFCVSRFMAAKAALSQRDLTDAEVEALVTWYLKHRPLVIS